MGQAGAHHTRDFEDVVAWLAQQMAKTPIAGLLRIGWDTVGHIVQRVVADHLDERRLHGLVAIGCGRLEGLNSRIRLISHRSFGLHSAGPLIALVYLCCTGIHIDLPR